MKGFRVVKNGGKKKVTNGKKREVHRPPSEKVDVVYLTGRGACTCVDTPSILALHPWIAVATQG